MNHFLSQMSAIEFWHVILALFSYAIFGLAALQAAVLAVQLHCLRHHPSAAFLSKIPPVETMQNLMFASITLGFTTLTLAIVLGVIFWEKNSDMMLGKGGLTLFAWAVYAGLLLAHLKLGLKLRLGILWTFLAWLGLTLAYFGTKLIA